VAETKDALNRTQQAKVHEFPRRELAESSASSDESGWRSAAHGISRGVAGLAMARIFHPTVAKKIQLRLQAIEIEHMIQRVLRPDKEESKAA